MIKGKLILFSKNYLPVIVLFICLNSCCKNISQSIIGDGWSNNSVNTVKFRKNALTTYKEFQFAAYYNETGFLILAKRKLNSKKWTVLQTNFNGNVNDAHNSISIAIDGLGYLHVSWDHHNTKLRYARSLEPLSLQLGEELVMTGLQEDNVTYPEFYNLPNGNLLFFYRSGESGRGNLVINSYSTQTKSWKQLQTNLINGENKRSSYWQACIDKNGVIHLSWVWRETWDVETNHDLCYAKSLDGGITWQKSNGELYKLPITLASAEYAWKITQGSNLINQTAMTTDNSGNPFIVNYWNDDNKIPQFQIVYLENNIWKKQNTAFRKSGFVLGGGGTKKVPISRPDILIDNSNNKKIVSVLFRDETRDNKVSVAQCDFNKIINWKVTDLSKDSLGQWEPNYDVILWNRDKKLHIFLQNVFQVDGEGLANKSASSVEILSIKNINKVINP
jgi:hypothetical protein